MPPFEYELGVSPNGNVTIDVTKKKSWLGRKFHEVIVTDEDSGTTFKMKLDEPFEVIYDKGESDA